MGRHGKSVSAMRHGGPLYAPAGSHVHCKTSWRDIVPCSYRWPLPLNMGAFLARLPAHTWRALGIGGSERQRA